MSNAECRIAGRSVVRQSRDIARWLLLIVLVLLVSCSSSGDSANTVGGDGRTPVTLTLNWFPDAQHGGFYAAELEGFFAAEGLDVTIVPGGPGVPVIQEAALGRSQFAIANADQVLLGREQDAKVKAIFAAMQTSPRCILVHQESGIASLQELPKLKTLAVGTGKSFATYLGEKVDLSKVQIVPYTGNIAPFLADKSSGQQGYVFSEPLVAEENGAEVTVLMVSEIGFDPYTSMVITSDAFADKNPKTVKAFARACQKGWEHYLENPDKTNAHIQTVNPQIDAKTLKYAVEQIKPLCLPKEMDAKQDNRLGTMSKARWTTLRDQLIDVKLLPYAAESNGAWTNAFLD